MDSNNRTFRLCELKVEKKMQNNKNVFNPVIYIHEVNCQNKFTTVNKNLAHTKPDRNAVNTVIGFADGSISYLYRKHQVKIKGGEEAEFTYGPTAGILVALFREYNLAQKCLNDYDLDPIDPRYTEHTFELISKIGFNHPIFKIDEDFAKLIS